VSNRSIAYLEPGVERTPRADAELADWRSRSAPTPVAAFGYWALPFVVGIRPPGRQAEDRRPTTDKQPDLGRGQSRGSDGAPTGRSASFPESRVQSPG
jgi:hypothetical protein